MNWTYFDERTPDDGQLIIAANLKGARQFWLWHCGYDMETMKILEMDFWCPVPDLPKPSDPFDTYWEREAPHIVFKGGNVREAAKVLFDAGREYERNQAAWKKTVPLGVKV